MSRIGKEPIPIPSGVDVTMTDTEIVVKGPKGELSQRLHPGVTVTVDDGQVTVTRPDDERDGYSKALEITGVGYRATKQGDGLRLQLGFSHDVTVDAPPGISFEVPTNTRIVVSGANKQQVGQVAANIRRLRPPEPYKGKGIRYADEQILRKAGKAAG